MHDMMCWTVKCRRENSDSNAWVVLTNIAPKQLRWCRTLLMPVSIQNYSCCPITLDWYSLLCHKQCNQDQLGANNGPVQHQKCVSVPSPFQVGDHLDELQSLVVLCLYHTDELLKGKVRALLQPEELH